MMAKETERSLAGQPRKNLAAIAREAGVYHPWLNRKTLAATLIRWREDSRRNVRLKIAKANHERLVRTPARKGVHVPEANLRMYGLDREGHYEPTILGVPLSQAIRYAPEAVEAARTLTAPAFREWLTANPNFSS